MSRSVGRILWDASVPTTIYLGLPLPTGSGNLPAVKDEQSVSAGAPQAGPPLGLAPGGVYQAAPVTWNAGGLLPHRFTLTRTSEEAAGGLFSVALSRTSPWVVVNHHRCSMESGPSSVCEQHNAAVRPTHPPCKGTTR